MQSCFLSPYSSKINVLQSEEGPFWEVLANPNPIKRNGILTKPRYSYGWAGLGLTMEKIESILLDQSVHKQQFLNNQEILHQKKHNSKILNNALVVLVLYDRCQISTRDQMGHKAHEPQLPQT